MSTVDTSTWNPDPDLNESLEGIPLNEDARISETWQVLRILMAAGGLHGLQLVTFDGATASADGKQGLVPAPEAGDQGKYLKGDGTWGSIPAPNLGTASRAVQTDANGALAVSSVTSTELGYLSGVTSNVQTQLNGKADMEDVSSTFTWSNGQNPAHFHAYRIGKLVSIFYQGQSAAHSNGSSLGTTTLSIAAQTFIPMVKNAAAYGTIDISPASAGSTISVSQISSSTASGRIYFNGSFVLA